MTNKEESTANNTEETFEQKFVHSFYNCKSQKFSNSRVKPWPFTIRFIENYTKDHSLVLDAGCGNGRQFLHENTIGLDFSKNLLLDASLKHNLGLIKGNVHDLPFKSKSFDVILSIAVIHHLSTHQRRLDCLLEMKRTLKDDGYCLIYVWHTSASSKQKFTLIKDTEYFVNWKGENDYLRYYCLFNEDMLNSLCLEAGFNVVEISREEQSLYAVVKKNLEAL